MEIALLIIAIPLTNEEKLKKKVTTFQNLLGELGERKLPEDVIMSINEHIMYLNGITTKGELSKELRKRQSKILALLLKKLKLVPKGYYRNMWMAVGMSAFGVSFGVAFGVALDNMAFLGIGIPIGMGIGIAIGTAMDAKAEKEGKQLEFAV
ncbi:hypothetical protein [uncultured Dokdonia sp.]|uniref:hypothetical protein n=1 Tax=uncultured Dokdonia sp. TaxID=575653 RepID=UPI0026042186|nr:hypothetical protein [uncultured Dokdonia sp.]